MQQQSIQQNSFKHGDAAREGEQMKFLVGTI
jgi:hypothetical protein